MLTYPRFVSDHLYVLSDVPDYALSLAFNAYELLIIMHMTPQSPLQPPFFHPLSFKCLSSALPRFVPCACRRRRCDRTSRTAPHVIGNERQTLMHRYFRNCSTLVVTLPHHAARVQ